jgi:hypothetical protein
MTYNCYITFPTIFYAIRAEEILKTSSYSAKMVPVPRSISSSCGTALQCNCNDVFSIKNHLLDNNCKIEGCYKIGEEGLNTLSIEELFKDE